MSGAGVLTVKSALLIATGNGVTINTASTTLDTTSVQPNKFSMSAKSALVITDGAYSVDADGKKTGTAVNLEGGVANSVVNDGGKVILAGNFTAADSNIQVFSGTTGFSLAVAILSLSLLTV